MRQSYWWMLLFLLGAVQGWAQPKSRGMAAEQAVLESVHGFEAASYERGCMQYFDDTCAGVNGVNVFLLAKMTELNVCGSSGLSTALSQQQQPTH